METTRLKYTELEFTLIKMDDKQKVYYPEIIEDTPFPTIEGEVTFDSSDTKSGDTFKNTTIKPQGFPTRKVAHEVIGSALNTKSRKILAEFEFTQTGAMQIGKYANGVSGDIRISPTGIVARNSSGLNTFALDGETGDATFAGTIQAGSLIAGIVAVGDNSIVIDGEARRMVWYDENDIPSIVIGNL